MWYLLDVIFSERILDMHSLNLCVYTRCSLNIGNAPVVKWAETMPLSTIIPTLINSSGHAPLPLWCIVEPSPSTRPEIFCIYIYIYVVPSDVFSCPKFSFQDWSSGLVIARLDVCVIHARDVQIHCYIFFSTIQFPLYIMDCGEIKAFHFFSLFFTYISINTILQHVISPNGT